MVTEIVNLLLDFSFLKKSTPFTENKLLNNTIITEFNLGDRNFFFEKRGKKSTANFTSLKLYSVTFCNSQ